MIEFPHERVLVLDRVSRRHPDVTAADAAYAWLHAVRSMPRLGTESAEYAAIGPDPSGRMLEVVAVALPDGSGWLIKYAQHPPQTSIRRELGLDNRKGGRR
ncbi:hypothetical protein [Actinomyces trachealis]|uniref:hypothetical protein n=1 Tax=Actinomyces trachealis TaxID=2763540 RepID=UPI0018929D10|nr:hypothetical protein [Actinomyces trachealis]